MTSLLMSYENVNFFRAGMEESGGRRCAELSKTVALEWQRYRLHTYGEILSYCDVVPYSRREALVGGGASSRSLAATPPSGM